MKYELASGFWSWKTIKSKHIMQEPSSKAQNSKNYLSKISFSTFILVHLELTEAISTTPQSWSIICNAKQINKRQNQVARHSGEAKRSCTHSSIHSSAKTKEWAVLSSQEKNIVLSNHSNIGRDTYHRPLTPDKPPKQTDPTMNWKSSTIQDI